MIILETERLILRTLELTDIDVVMDFWGDPEVMKYCGGAGSKERELRALQFYVNMQKDKGFSPYLVVKKETDEVVGVCGFNPPGEGYDAELMYHLAKKHWGKGFATEAAKACIDYGMNVLQFKKIEASIDPRNHASQKILEKIGFQYIGMKWCSDTQQNEPFFEFVNP